METTSSRPAYYKIVGGTYRRRYATREQAESVRKMLRPHGHLKVLAFNATGKVVKGG